MKVDMHAHLLPGIDDGLTSIESTIQFLELLQKAGYQKCICTPHIFSSVHPNSPQTILPVLQQVRNQLDKRNIAIKVEAAAEYMVDEAFELTLKEDKPLLTFGDNYILIEMSYAAPSPYLNSVIFELKLKGLQPILAHPERYSYYHNNFNQYIDFKNRGCLLQLNLLSLTNYYGVQTKKVAEKLIKNNMIDFLGTDIHHEKHLKALLQLKNRNRFFKLFKDKSFLNHTL